MSSTSLGSCIRQWDFRTAVRDVEDTRTTSCNIVYVGKASRARDGNSQCIFSFEIVPDRKKDYAMQALTSKLYCPPAFESPRMAPSCHYRMCCKYLPVHMHTKLSTSAPERCFNVHLFRCKASLKCSCLKRAPKPRYRLQPVQHSGECCASVQRWYHLL